MSRVVSKIEQYCTQKTSTLELTAQDVPYPEPVMVTVGISCTMLLRGVSYKEYLEGIMYS